MAGLSALLIFVSNRDSAPATPPELLDDARVFVAGAKTVKYTGDFEVEVPDPESQGSGLVQRGSFAESAVFPGRGRSVIELNGVVTETVFIGDDRYTRDAETKRALDDEQFGRIALDQFDEIGLDLDSELLFDKPQALGRVFRQASRPRVVRRSDSHTLLRVQLPPDVLPSFGAEGAIDDVDGALTLGVDGRPERLAIRTRGGFSSTTTLVFRDWDTDVRIEEPDEDDLDPTPFVDEERVAAYDEATLFQPAAIPVGWELDLADVITDEASGLDCAQVFTVFTDAEADAPDAGGLALIMMPVSCSSAAPPGSEEFSAGPYRGWIATDVGAGVLLAQLDVEGTAVQLTTSLSREQLVEVVSALAPLDLENPPPATISLAEVV